MSAAMRDIYFRRGGLYAGVLIVSLLCLLPGIKSIMASCSSVGSNQITNFIEDTSTVIKNPGIGYQVVGTGDPNLSNLPSSVYYNRYDWSAIEQTVGSYTWTPIDNDLANATSGGQALTLRIMGFEDGNTGVQAYKTAGYPGNNFTFNSTSGVYFPSIANSSVKTAMTNIVNALKTRYGSTAIAIDAGFIGAYGEYNFFGTSPAQTYPATADTEAFLGNFTSWSIPVIVGGDLYLYDPAAFSWAMSHNFGWRVDCWGDLSSGGDQQPGARYDQTVAAYPNQWQTAPIYLEVCSDMSQWVSAGYSWQYSLDWAVNNHASGYNNKGNAIPGAMTSAVKSMTSKLGYRIFLSQAVLPSLAQTGAALNFSINWVNRGNAPLYWDRHILIKIGSQVYDSGVSLKGFQPGNRTDTFVINQALPSGTYQIQIGLAPPPSTTPDIKLAVSSAGAGPWYSLGTLQLQ
jgi:Domain of unknown function (DUF4832)